MAGRLLESDGDTDEGVDLVATDFFRWSVSFEAPTAPRSPGYLRWGRGEGCGFVQRSAREWPSNYLCGTNNDYGCSADYRLSAVCSLKSGVTVPQV
jgi:hypothetical protein